MRIDDAAHARPWPPRPEVVAQLHLSHAATLRTLVSRFAVPRHADAQPEANQRMAQDVAERFRQAGYQVTIVGDTRNVLAMPAARPHYLVGAHYDSVPQTCGADDNASGLAVLLQAAAVIRAAAPVAFVAFNQEEDGGVGSAEFVQRIKTRWRAVHILEMVGYTAATQQTPRGLPIAVPATGDFLGVIGNARSRPLVDTVLQAARTYVPQLPVLGLKPAPLVADMVPVLWRSDHAAFWKAGLRAVMWTDTAEFRNPHYHSPRDTPDTLDYAFMDNVLRLLLATLCGR